MLNSLNSTTQEGPQPPTKRALAGQKKISQAILTVIFLLLALACKGGSNRISEEVELPAPTEAPAEEEEEPAEVLITPFQKEEKVVVDIETIIQNNCGGTAPVSNEHEASRMIRYEMQVGSEISVKANGGVDIPFLGEANIGIEIAGYYGKAYGEEETLSDSITVSAEEGTRMIHRIEHIEFWKTGEFTVKKQEKRFDDEYKLRRRFGFFLRDSVNLGCDSSTPIVKVLGNTKPEYRKIRVEVVQQNNCGGNREEEYKIELGRRIAHTIEVGNEVINGNEDINIEVDLGTEIAKALGYSYGLEQNISRSITLKAKAGTYVEHDIRLSEVWEVGRAIVVIDEEIKEIQEIPFSFRTDFAIDLVESRELNDKCS